MFSKNFIAVILIFNIFGIFVGCTATRPAHDREGLARQLFQNRCVAAGEKIKKTVDNVEGVFILKLRPKEINFKNQFVLDDPYGRDLTDEAYLETFLRKFYEVKNVSAERSAPLRSSLIQGYEFVDVVNKNDGVRYRYTGLVEEPWRVNKNYLKGYTRFLMTSRPASRPAPRYGVTYDDISTLEDRKYWIAGSSLKVVDLENNEVIAERVGYMYDPGQGSEKAGRAPWLLAADYACPSFGNTNHNASFQRHQAARFVGKVLHPKRD